VKLFQPGDLAALSQAEARANRVESGHDGPTGSEDDCCQSSVEPTCAHLAAHEAHTIWLPRGTVMSHSIILYYIYIYTMKFTLIIYTRLTKNHLNYFLICKVSTSASI
jgi:hypothetical protein